MIYCRNIIIRSTCRSISIFSPHYYESLPSSQMSTIVRTLVAQGRDNELFSWFVAWEHVDLVTPRRFYERWYVGLVEKPRTPFEWYDGIKLSQIPFRPRLGFCECVVRPGEYCYHERMFSLTPGWGTALGPANTFVEENVGGLERGTDRDRDYHWEPAFAVHAAIGVRPWMKAIYLEKAREDGARKRQGGEAAGGKSSSPPERGTKSPASGAKSGKVSPRTPPSSSSAKSSPRDRTPPSSGKPSPRDRMSMPSSSSKKPSPRNRSRTPHEPATTLEVYNAVVATLESQPATFEDFNRSEQIYVRDVGEKVRGGADKPLAPPSMTELIKWREMRSGLVAGNSKKNRPRGQESQNSYVYEQVAREFGDIRSRGGL